MCCLDDGFEVAAVLARRGQRWLCMLARATLWRKAARVLPRAAASRSLLCSLEAGNAGFYAGASHPVARADATAAWGGGYKALASYHAGATHTVARVDAIAALGGGCKVAAMLA